MSTLQVIMYSGALIICLTYSALIAFFTFGWFRLSRFNPTGQIIYPRVTVIIAARNEETQIEACLSAIAAQDYPKNLFDVIVIDDHSTDGTADLVRKIISEHPLIQIRLLTPDTASEGKKASISLAIDSAGGEWIVTTDADCIMDQQWLSTLMQSSGDDQMQMLLAPVVFKREKSVFGQLQELEFMSLLAASAGAANIGMPVMCNGANLAYRKNAFKKINGFTADKSIASGDDMFLMMKIRKTYGPGAIRFVKSTSAIITTQANATLVEFVNQRLRWVSKSRGYRDAWVIATSAVVYFFSLSTIISLMAWAFGFTGPLLPVTLLTVKMVADFPLMASYAHFANRSRLLIWYIPLQIIYIFYVTLFGALGNILPFRWKGRELR